MRYFVQLCPSGPTEPGFWPGVPHEFIHGAVKSEPSQSWLRFCTGACGFCQLALSPTAGVFTHTVAGQLTYAALGMIGSHVVIPGEPLE